jgi:sec-independent protein translocase protein TatA
MGLSFSHILLVLIVALVVFGAGRLPSIMTDLAKGLRAFKDGLREAEDKPQLLTDASKKSEKDV